MRIHSWLSLCSLGVLVAGCHDLTEPNGDTGVTAKRAASGHVAVTELATLPGGQFSTATGINAQGDIVGWATTATGQEHAVLWHNGEITDLGTLGGTFSQAHAINNRGMVVGRATTTGGSESLESAFLWQDGSMINLGVPAGATYSVGLGINPAGVVMAYTDAGFATWNQGAWNMLPHPAGTTDCGGGGIDNAGRVIGYCHVGTQTRSFIWDHGVPTDLGVIPGGDVVALAISPSGVVVGEYFTGEGGGQTFIWRHGRLIDAPDIYPAAINAAGAVVGGLSAGIGSQHAALWRRGTTVDLGVLPGGSDSYATGINAAGQIVGWSFNASGAFRAVVWTTH